MKRKEIAKRAIAFTASMVMCVTSIPVNLAAGPAEMTAAEKSLDSISSDGANESNGPGGAESDTGSGEAGDPDGTDQGAGSGGAGEPSGTGQGGSSGENGDPEGITPGAGSGETNGPDGTESGGNTGGSQGQDGTEPGENTGEAGDQDGTEPGGSGGESGGAEGTEPGQDGDNIQQPPSEPGRTTAIDWTNNMDVLTISLSGISWESQEGTGNCVRNDQGQWDLSALYEEKAQTVTLNYDISMNNDSREPLAAGDTFSILLPSGLFAAEPDSGNLNPEKEKPEAAYATSNSVVQVTLRDEVEQEGFSGFQASLGIKAVPLSYEPGETERIETIVMQSMTDAGGEPVRENKAEFFLPAKDGEEPGPDDNGLDKPEEETPEDGKTEENPEDGKTEDEAPGTEPKDLSNEISVDLARTELEVGTDDTVELPVVYIIPEATEIQPNDSFALSVDGITLISAAATKATAWENRSPMVLTAGETVPEIPEEDGSTEITSPPEKTEISVSQPIVKENQITTIFTEPAVAAAQLQGTILLRASVSRQDAEKGKATFSIQGKNYETALLLPKTDEGNKQVSFTKEWIGTSPETVYPNLLESGMVKVWYSLGDAPATEWKSGDLGIGKWEKGDKGNYTVTSQGVGFETYTLTLPEEWNGQAVTYSFTEDAGQAINNGYIAADTAPDAENRFHNIVTAEFEAELEIRDGDVAKDFEFFKSHLTLSGKGTDGTPCEWNLTNLPENVQVSVEGNHLVIANLPGFTLDQEEIIYSLKADARIELGNPSGDIPSDYYDPTYDNQAAANFGTVTDTCHNGGTLILLLKGETSYEGTKEWIDDKSDDTRASRPDAVLYLWRYSKAGSDYTTASQVKDPDDETQNVSWPLHPVTDDIEEVSKSSLPKYDPEGYKYTYFAKEILSGNNAGNYEQVLGAITPDTDGNAVITDTYKGPEERRPEGDYYLYNGGTLSNRRVGKVPLTVTKKWEAASFQDQLENVTVYMTLQCKPAGEDNAAWTDIPGEYKLDGFFAEQMSKTLTASADQFDPFGKELEYRWVESDVKQIVDGQEQGTNFDKDNRTFSLRQMVDGVEEEIEYQSSYDETDSTMTNRIADTTDYTVEKHWKGTEGDKIPPEPNSKVTVILYRSDDETKPYTTFSMDGNTDADKTGLDNPAIGYGQETEPYIIKFTGLPKYDESGHRYTYIAEEEAFSVNGQPWHTTYKYDVKERKADITNEPTGEGTIIRVRKKWIDDSDESHRIPVQVQVFDKKTNEKVGDPVTLDSTNNWWAEVGVKKDTKAEDYYIRELQTETLWSQDAAPAEDTDTQKIFEPDSYANSEHHKYFVTYNNDTADARGMLCVTNRRVGLVDLTVTKNWVDQDNNADRPTDLKLKLYCQEHEDAIDYTNNTINFGNDSLPIKLSDGSEGSAIQAVAYDTQSNTYTYSFYNLPKYDGEGKVVHYYIKEEEGTTGSIAGAEYATPVISYGTYIPGRTSDSPDTQEITVTNKKSKAKPVTFYKLWKDAYAYGQGKRPDIYLDLWKTDSKNPTPVPVPDHINYLWTRASDPTNSAYKWTCDFGDLPKYDSNGKEITYYAEEKTHVSADALGYDTSPEAVMDKDGTYKDQYPSTQPGQTGTENTTISAGEKTLLKEGGTFVNKLTGTITITGKKIWKNIPDGMPFEDFPGLTIKASRSLTAPQGGKTTVDVQQLVRLMKPGIRPLLVTPVHNGFVKTGSDTWKEIASTKLSVENRIPGTNDFMFTMNKTGDNDTPDPAGTNLDKYDEDGNLYYYKVEEEVTNAENLSGTTYESLPGEVNNFIITNVYNQSDGNTGNLTVNKTWDGIFADDLKGKYQYPAVEFTLWRNYESNAADSTKTISKDEKVTAMILKSGTDISGTVTFEKLLVTAPNGNKYNYFVDEKILNGYDTTNGNDDIEIRKSEIVTLEKTPADAAEFTASVSFKNTYNPEQKVSLTGSKEWKDNGNAFKTRPLFSDFKNCYTVYRYADKQPGADGAPEIKDEDITGELQGADENAPYYLKWSNTDTDTWTYSILNLDRYAPNSMPWKYKIKEQKIQGYDNSEQIIDSAKGPLDDSGNITMPEWINLNLKCAKLVKSWQGENSYGLRPGTIAAELWVKLGDGAADGKWEKASEVFANFGDKAKAIPTTADVMPYSSGQWGYTFEGLPAYLKKSDNSIVSCSYQVVETKAGDYETDIKEVKVSDNGVVYPKVGPYQPESGEPELKPDIDTTAITNNYGDDTKYLKITKTWENDTNNYYSTRPGDNNSWYADFAMYYKAEGGTDWSQYKNADGKNIILRVTGDNTQDTVTMKFGPFPAADSNGKAYSYAAAEIAPAKGNYKITETVIVERSTEKLTVTPDTSAENILTVSGTEITEGDTTQYASKVSAVNSLLTTKVTITKKWEDDGNTAFRPGNIKISLKKSIAGDTENTITDVPMENQPGWTENDNNTWTAVIENLPAYDEKGQRYEYTAEEEQLSNYQPPEISDTVSDSDINRGEALTITNKISQFEISKILTGGREDESLPAGAKLEIYKASDGAAAGEPAAIWECSTGESNEVKVTTTVKKDGNAIWTETVTADTAPVKGVIKGLDAGNYILRETIAPAGYETAADIPFTLKEDGTVSLTAGEAGSVTSDGNGIYCITMTDRKISVQIQKVNLDGTELTGAKFTVTGIFANKKEQQTLTPEEANKAGYLVSSDGTNPQNIYTLTETTAPEGYIKSEASTTFWTDKNGIVHITSDNKISGGTKLAETDKSDNSKIIYRNGPILLYLEKHDKTGDGTSALAGAVFTLTDKGTDGKGTNILSDNVITTSESLLLNDLIQGHYYSLREKTAPDGYILPAEDSRTFTFRVSENGKIENLNGPEGFRELDKGDTLIKIFNTPIVIELKKTDKASGEGIEGTSFTLHDESVQGTAEDKTVKTDSQGSLTLKGLEHGLVQGHIYTLTETPAEGYDLPENKLTIAFEVNQNGTIKILKANYTDGNDEVEVTDRVAGSSEGNTATIKIQNIRQKGSAEILKVDGDEITKVLSGAVFRLQKKNDKDKYEDVGEIVTTNGDGKAYFESLEWGDYRIREVTPPAGYALSETVFDFTISATSLKASFTDAASDNAFKNEKTNVKIMKKEEGGSGNPALDGARFAIYKLDGPDKDPAGSPVWESDTSAPGTMQLSGVLSVETYYAIAETSAPAGYEKLEQYVILKLKCDVKSRNELLTVSYPIH
ncbi:MAG: SpaA isopeptide-forming pilin-related protein, partial [Eubacteriales bacterium]|nr:SpaA isopeptide-forming pilin-related protein [Eubacteriales bacterium]